MKDTTLLIQGPLKVDTYRFYCHSYPDIPKVFSVWEGNDKTYGWTTGREMHGPDDVFVESSYPNDLGAHARSLQLQVVGTLAGLERVKTKYAIKLRGDEWYSNLGSVEERMVANQEKIHCVPVFFRNWGVFPFHPSDHLMASKTDNLRMMFEGSLLRILARFDVFEPERVLAKAYIDRKIGPGWQKEDFRRLFDIIPMETLQPYKVSMNTYGRTWYSNFNPHDDGSLGSISSMDEL